MQTDYNPNSPIETLFTQIEDAAEFVAHAEAPYTIEQILNISLNILQYIIGAFCDSIKTQKRFPDGNKTQYNFKINFTDAHNEYLNEVRTGKHFNEAQK